MNILFWVVQILASFLYATSGFMKVFMFHKISQDVPSFDALPQRVWTALGIVELICAAGLIVRDALHWHPHLTVLAAAVLAVESLLFIWVHIRYREVAPTIMSAI